MRGGENSDQFAFALQRDGDFGARIGLAGHVVGVTRDVGSVVHLASGGDVPHHSRTHLDAMALAVNTAAANAGQYEFRLFGIAQIEVDFDATERRGNLVDDPRNEVLYVESGSDALRELLQAHQFGDPECGRIGERLSGEAEIHERAGGHDETLLPKKSITTVNKIAGIRVQILFLFGFLPGLMWGWMSAA